MAAATIQKAAAAGRDILAGRPRQREKDFVAHFSNENEPLSPGQVADDPKHKQLGMSRKLEVADFELARTLGTGTFARVWLARLAKPNQGDRDKVYALKVLRKADIIRLKQVEHVQNERAVLAGVAGHPFITTMIGSFSDRDALYMLLDYCPGGEVFTYLRRARRFDTTTAQFYGAEIVLILEFLHKNGIAYRDMKPENLLIDAEGHIKLVDFGFAKRLEGTAVTYTLCGTPEYLAPEVIQSKGHGTSVDWWAFGILLYEFLVGQPPFWDQNPMKIYEKIVNEPVRFPRGMPFEAQDLITRLCTVDLSQRIGNISGGASRVKEHPFFHGIDWHGVYYRHMQGPIIPHLRHGADTSNFDEYPDEDDKKEAYTDEMYHKYDEAFRDF
ncbi:MAG: serine/threonine protein kinase, AGC [Piccolia ochrophora]|nr:MAG: serine/threonine protein kinase, AGC [Piccolia ochrophora]